MMEKNTKSSASIRNAETLSKLKEALVIAEKAQAAAKEAQEAAKEAVAAAKVAQRVARERVIIGGVPY